MKKKLIYRILFFALLISANFGFSQGDFKLFENVKKSNISFKLVNNLVVFPMEVNGKKLNFILDSGVGTTILFNINYKDSIQLNNVRKVKLKGLGSEEPIDAVLSRGNVFSLNNIIGRSQDLYVIFDDSFDLSSKIGMTIHGIIGYDILKDFVVKINYGIKRLTFYNPTTYKAKRCKKCETFNLEFYKYKPYINLGVKLDSNEITNVKLLVDSGGSDAMWLFENSHPNILPPKKYFIDYLGEGLSGVIYGKRSIIKGIVLGKLELKNPTVSYPDSSSISHARLFKERNGSLGGTILNRFIVTFNYPKASITLKKGGAFNEPFRYNMSGIELVHYGKVLVKEREFTNVKLTGNGNTGSNNRVVLDYNYKYKFKPTYKIFKIREDSHAYEVGLRQDDVVIKINGEYTYNLQLDEIVAKFYQKEGRKIRLVVERQGMDYEYEFKLKNMLK